MQQAASTSVLRKFFASFSILVFLGVLLIVPTLALAQDTQDVTLAEAKRIVRLVRVQIGEGLFREDDPNRVLEEIKLIDTDVSVGCDPLNPDNPCATDEGVNPVTPPSGLSCIGLRRRLPLSGSPTSGGHGSFGIFLDPPGDDCDVVLGDFPNGVAIGGSVFTMGDGSFDAIFVDGSTAPGLSGFAFVCEDPIDCIFVNAPPSPVTLTLTRREVSANFTVRFTLTFETIDATSCYLTIDNVEIL